MGHLNIEIKAKCNNPSKLRELIKTKKPKYIGTDHQIDTYFQVKNGRLKLREGNIENHLIFYERDNKKGPKASKIMLYTSSSASVLKEILTKSMGIKVIVDKKREIYFIDNVKFHIDTVKKLGTFIEIEAIDKDGNIGEVKLLKQCQDFLEFLGIKKADLIKYSYSDLLLQK